MKKLYDGTQVPTTINTDERIFLIHTFDGEDVLCNTEIAKELLKNGLIKTLKHLWDFKFQSFSKLDLKQM